MKSKCSFILKASLSLVLALLMLFGTVATSVAAVVDTADTGADSADVADTGADAEDIADTGADADIADTSYVVSDLKYLYLKKTTDSTWTKYSLSNGSYTANITSTGSYNFKFETNNGNQYTNNGNITASVSGWEVYYMYSNSNPGTVNVSTAGNYTFSLSLSGDKIYMTVVYPTQTSEATEAAVSGSGTDMTPAQYIYLRPNSDWASDNAWFAMYYWTGDNNGWVTGTAVGNTGLYRFAVPTDSWWTTKNLSFKRMRPSSANGYSSDNSGLNWSNPWNHGGDTTITAGSDIWKVKGWDNNGEWEGTGYGYTISSAVSPSGSGTVTKTDDNAGVDAASTGQFTASANNGYAFKDWTIPTGVTLATGYTKNNRTIKFNADRAATLTANFDVAYTVTLPSIENATVTATCGDGQTLAEGNTVTVASGTSVSITAVPGSNYKITNIQGTDKTGLGNQTQSIASVSSNTVISVIVEEKTKYTVTTANNDPSLGTITVSPDTTAANYKDTITVYEGATVHYKATPLNGKLTKIVRKNTTANTQESNTYNQITVLSTYFTMPSGNVEVAATFQDYVGTSKYYYDGWKNDSATSPGSSWNNVRMTEGLYNGQKYAYFHATTARPTDSNYGKFSISYRESGNRYVYFWDNRDGDIDNWKNNPVAVFEDATGGQIAAVDCEYVSGKDDNSHLWKFKIPQSSTNDFNRVAKVYFTNGKTSGWQRTESKYIWESKGCFSRGGKSANNNTWYILQYDSTARSDSNGTTLYYWGTPNGAGTTYQQATRFGSDIELKYADIGNYKDNLSMVHPETSLTDYYIILYYPNTNYGTIAGQTANNTNSYPIVVAATELPSAMANRATIYAKDGVINEGRESTRVIGTTTVTEDAPNVKSVSRGSISYTDNNTSKTLECYTSARAVKGEQITVTTTISNTYGSKYLVKGWDVNGETYGLNPTASGNSYSVTFTVPNADKIEITPIYWLKSGNVTTFFVKDFNNVPAAWGNALYYYYWGGSQVNVDAEERYPGQPFVHEGGQYYAQVPTDVTGITLNNAVWDTIHGQYMMGLVNDGTQVQKAHYQTYDYDNFAKIVKEKSNINSVYFTFKYESKKDNFNSSSGGSTINVADFNDSNGNGWEEYKDPLGRPNNIFGGTEVSGTGRLYVVSNGYARNYQGNFATEWSVYYASTSDATSASKVCTLPGSALIMSSAASFNNYSSTGYTPALSTYSDEWTTLNGATYKNLPVYITYEKAIEEGYSLITNDGTCPKDAGGQDADHKDTATRMDGKWDYVLNSDYSTADIKIQYSDDNGITFNDDSFTSGTNTGTVTGAQAYFNNPGASYANKHVVTTNDKVIVSTTNKYMLKSVPQPSTGYQFVGWYRLDDGSTNPELIVKSTEAESLMSAKATFIARYKLVQNGTLLISHVANGEGKATNHTLKAEIFESGANVDTDLPIAKFEGDSVTLEDDYIKSSSTYKIRVSLTAIADANSYIANSSTVPTVACSQDTATYYNSPTYTRSGRYDGSTYPVNVKTVLGTFTVGSLFNNTNQKFKVLTYTTTFNKLPTYTINYRYHGRNMTGSDYLTFARTITLSHDEAEGINADGETYSGNGGVALRPTYIVPSGSSLINDITANAPNQNDLQTEVFNKNIAWSVPSTVTADSLDVYATETDPTYTLTYTYVDGNGTKQTKTVEAEYNKLITLGEKIGETDTFATADIYDGKKFKYWALGSASGDPLTSTREYKMRLVNDVTIYPVYDNSANGWTAAIDKITRTHETSDTSDYIFTDFALRFSGFDENGSFIHINPDFKTKYKVGVAVVYDTEGNNTTETTAQLPDGSNPFFSLTKYTDAQNVIQTLVNRNLSTAKLSQINATTYVSKYDADNNKLTNFNRIDYALKYNYNTYYKRSYDAYAYIIDTDDTSGGTNANGTVIAVSPVKSGYIFDGKLPSGAGN